MAFFKLTEKIWYGNMDAPVQLRGQYKSILDLAEGYEKPPYHYTFDQIDRKVISFRFPRTEDELVDSVWCGMLTAATNSLFIADTFPLLVHCFAGQCRAPITAVFLAWWHFSKRQKEDAELLLDRMRQLSAQHGVDEKRLYHKSMRELMFGLAGVSK